MDAETQIRISRLGRSAEAYEVIARLHTAVYPRFPQTPAEVARDDKYAYHPDHRRWLAQVNGEPVGFSGIGKMTWSDRPGKLYLEFVALESADDLVREALVRPALEVARAEGADTIGTFTQADQVRDGQFKASLGFVPVHQDEDSELLLENVDWKRWLPVLEAMGDLGVELVTLAEYRRRCPEATERMYDLYAEVFPDVPSPEPLTPRPLENYREYVERPEYPAHIVSVAVEGLRPVGMLTQNLSEVDPSTADVGLAGVARSHRGRGIAKALKVHSLQLLAGAGVRLVRTGNNESNPMYRLNRAIGFQPLPPWVHLALRLTPEASPED